MCTTCQGHAGARLSCMKRVGANFRVQVPGPDLTVAPGPMLSFRMCNTKHCLLRQPSQDPAFKCANPKPPPLLCLQPEKIKCPVQAHVGEDDSMDFAKKEVRCCHTSPACNCSLCMALCPAITAQSRSGPSSWHRQLHFAVWPGHISNCVQQSTACQTCSCSCHQLFSG